MNQGQQENQPNFTHLAWAWTGFGGRTLWDWMDLILVPLFIAGAAAFLSFLEIERNEERARLQEQGDRNRAQQSVLDDYLYQIDVMLSYMGNLGVGGGWEAWQENGFR